MRHLPTIVSVDALTWSNDKIPKSMKLAGVIFNKALLSDGFTMVTLETYNLLLIRTNLSGSTSIERLFQELMPT